MTVMNILSHRIFFGCGGVVVGRACRWLKRIAGTIFSVPVHIFGCSLISEYWQRPDHVFEGQHCNGNEYREEHCDHNQLNHFTEIIRPGLLLAKSADE